MMEESIRNQNNFKGPVNPEDLYKFLHKNNSEIKLNEKKKESKQTILRRKQN